MTLNVMIPIMLIRVERFWKNATLSLLCQIVVGTPIPKLHIFMLPLSLVAGPQKIWTVTLKWATTKKWKNLTFVKVLPETKYVL